MFDLTPATDELARLVRGVSDEQLSAPTPCPALSVAEILGHVHGLSVAFRDAAAKIDGPTTRTPPTQGTPTLTDNWRTDIPQALQELGAAWREPDAWTGMTAAGGMDLPGEITGAIAGNEVTIHAWDLAAATGQQFHPCPIALEHSYGFCAETPDDQRDGGLFGPVVPVPDDAPLLDRTLGVAGRDPRWLPTAH